MDGLVGINSSGDISSGHTVDADIFCEWKCSDGSFLSYHSAFLLCVLMCVCVRVRMRGCACVSWSNADSQSKLWEFNLSRAMLCSPDNKRTHTHKHTLVNVSNTDSSPSHSLSQQSFSNTLFPSSASATKVPFSKARNLQLSSLWYTAAAVNNYRGLI